MKNILYGLLMTFIYLNSSKNNYGYCSNRRNNRFKDTRTDFNMYDRFGNRVRHYKKTSNGYEIYNKYGARQGYTVKEYDGSISRYDQYGKYLGRYGK